MQAACALALGLTLGFSAWAAQPAAGAEVKVLSAGAMKEVVLAVVSEFEKQTGHKVNFSNDTVGGLVRRIERGEEFDLAVLTPAAVDELAKKGKIDGGSRTDLARVGVGVAVKAGAPVPDISSVEAFKRTLLAAKSVAYIDPASGGSSGIYFASLLEKLGIADEIRPKAKLKQGGYVAELIVNGEAELGVHQISEILPVKGVTLVGPLPAEIQRYTVYAGGISADTKVADPARALLSLLAGPSATTVMKERGMERPS